MMLVPELFSLFILLYPYGRYGNCISEIHSAKGLFGDQKWIGLDNFTYLINMPGAMSALRNTVVIAFLKSYWGLWFPITVAILLNEVRSSKIPENSTDCHLPSYFTFALVLLWRYDRYSFPSQGIVNQVLNLFGIDSIFFLGSNNGFSPQLS